MSRRWAGTGSSQITRNRQLRGPEDDHSRIFYAEDDGEVVAACRFNWGAEGFSERQIEQYQLEPFLREVPHEVMLIGERTMVAASHRGGSVYVDLSRTPRRRWQRNSAFCSGSGPPNHISCRTTHSLVNDRSRLASSSVKSRVTSSPRWHIRRVSTPRQADHRRVVRGTIVGSPTVRNAVTDGAEQYVAALSSTLEMKRPGRHRGDDR